jgi:hypothetical protein
MTKNAERRDKFRKRGVMPTPLEREWRAYLGESPNPWGGSKSADAANEDEDMKRAGPQTMQIDNGRKKSKLEIRTLAMGSTATGEMRC